MQGVLLLHFTVAIWWVEGWINPYDSASCM